MINQIIQNSIKYAKEAININQANVDAYIILAECYLNTGKDTLCLNTFKSAEDNAKVIGEKLIQEGHSQTGVIKENSKKAIDANIKSVKNEIMKETAEQALSLAEEKIKKALENDPGLHHKYIYESIDAIDRIGVDL